jgi:hypothetical protein
MTDNRKYKRFELEEEIMFARQLIHPNCYYGGTTINYSMCGICVVSRYEVVPGDNLCLRIIGRHLHSSTSLENLTCMAEVKWCHPVDSAEQPSFLTGLHYLGDKIPSFFKP